MQLGCVNTTAGHTGCTQGQLDVGIRQAAFTFAPGERVTALSLFAGPDNSGAANARAGAIRFSTSLVRAHSSLPWECKGYVSRVRASTSCQSALFAVNGNAYNIHGCTAYFLRDMCLGIGCAPCAFLHLLLSMEMHGSMRSHGELVMSGFMSRSWATNGV